MIVEAFLPREEKVNIEIPETGKLVAVFDIGSASIGGALVLKSEARPLILYSTRIPVSFQETIDFNRYKFVMLEAIENVAEKLNRNVEMSKYQSVECFLASPWYAGQARKVTLEKKKPFSFTKRLFDELVQKDVEEFKKAHLKRFREKGDPAEIIESKVIEIKLNGYPTSEPFDKKAHQVEMNLFVSVAPRNILRGIEARIRSVVAAKDIQFHSFILPFFSVLRETSDEKDFLFVDAGGEVTDVVLVEDGILKEVVSFPFGRNALIRRIARRLNRPKEEAASFLSLYLSSHLEHSLQRKLDAILDEGKKDFLSHFQKVLAEVGENRYVPPTIFLTADDDIAKWFKSAIEREAFSQYFLTEKEFHVSVLSARTIHDLCDFYSIKTSRDPFLMLEALYI